MLNTEPNIASPDDLYEALIALHGDLTPEQSRAVDARLILLLSNHIGDAAVLRQAIDGNPDASTLIGLLWLRRNQLND